MNQDIKFSTVVMILFVFSGILSAKFWASSASKSVRVFTYLHQHPDGGSFIKVNNQLFGFAANGQYQTTIDLAKMQVQQSNQTDFAFFSNGDLLLRQQTRNNNFIENLQRYFRFQNPTDKISADQKDGLFRCHPSTFECMAFTRQPLNLNSTFSLAIDWATDRVAIADTSRHRIYLYSSSGEELDSANSFQFPNQVEMVNNKLYVADTNHHRLIAFDISEDQLGNIAEVFDTRTEASSILGDSWPSAFLLLHDKRWVINNNNDMRNGGIYVFAENGTFIKKLQLPAGADPVALVQMGQQVLVADFSFDRLYRYNLAGEQQGEFNPQVLQSKLSKLIARRAYYDRLNDGFSILFALCLAGGFLLALHQQQMKSATTSEQFNTVIQLKDEPVLHWIKPSTRFKILLGVLIVLNAGLIITLAVIYWLMGVGMAEFFSRTWAIQLIILVATIILLLQLRRRVGVTQNTLIIQPPVGSKSVCHKSNIISNDVLLVIGKSVFKINQLYFLFSASDIENYLYPAIQQGQQVDRAQMWAVLAKNNVVRILQVMLILVFTGMFIYYGVFS